MSIEDVILEHDRRGVSALRPHLRANFCEEAARFILDKPGTVFIVTGFYILSAGLPETDGPPGALAIGGALKSLGYRVLYVTDKHTAPLMASLSGSPEEVIDFPIVDDETSDSFARNLLARHNPSLLISIERCGVTAMGLYLNMRGVDISAYNAKVDYLFKHHSRTVGIGDGGNEIGMGNLAHIIPQVESLPQEPAATRVTHLVIASVSNWGGYGLVAALSRLVGKDLLPSEEEAREAIERTARLGAVDGILVKQVPSVDGFSVEENLRVLARLRELVEL